MAASSDVIVFNPFDSRSVGWDIAKDITTPQEAREFADALILPAAGDDKPFFTNAARNIIAGVIDSLNRRKPREWTFRDLMRISSVSKRVQTVLSGTDLIDQFFSPQDTFDNVRNTIANVTVPLETVGDIWERTRKVSLKKWAREGGSVLVLGGRENLQATLQPLNRVAFKIITTEILSERESAQHTRLWFFCDELRSAGRLDTLYNMLNARSKGVRCALGFQDMEGLFRAYGNQDEPKEIIGRCGTISCLKLATPDTAEWASKRMGDVERYEYLGEDQKEQLAKREAIMPSEFQHLPDFYRGYATGFHLIRGMGGIFRHTTHYEFPKQNNEEDFQPRPASDLEPIPWSAADDARLGFDDPESPKRGSSEPNSPNGPDLDSLGRVEF